MPRLSAIMQRNITVTILTAAISISAWGAGGNQSSSTASSSNQSSQSSASPATSSGAIEAQFLTYSALDAVTRHIATALCPAQDAPAVNFVVLDQPSLNALGAFNNFYADINTAANFYLHIVPQPIPAPVNAAYNAVNHDLTQLDAKLKPPGVVNSLAATGGATSTLSVTASYWATFLPLLAQSSSSQSVQSITISNTAVALSFLKQQNSCANAHFFYPTLGLQSAIADNKSASLKVTQTLADLYVLRNLVNSSIATGAYDPITQVNTDLTTADPTSGNPGHSQIVAGLALGWLLEQPDSRGVLFTTLGSGGTARDRKTVWTMLWNGDLIDYRGGVIIGYLTTRSNENNELELVQQGSQRAISNFTEVKGSSNLSPTFDNGDDFDADNSCKKPPTTMSQEN